MSSLRWDVCTMPVVQSVFETLRSHHQIWPGIWHRLWVQVVPIWLAIRSFSHPYPLLQGNWKPRWKWEHHAGATPQQKNHYATITIEFSPHSVGFCLELKSSEPLFLQRLDWAHLCGDPCSYFVSLFAIVRLLLVVFSWSFSSLPLMADLDEVKGQPAQRCQPRHRDEVSSFFLRCSPMVKWTN